VSAGRGSTVAVVLARAGSKGVPGKNRAVVGGRACVLWTLDAAGAAETVGTVAISTDDAAIRELARPRGARVIERPGALASDGATVDDAARHAVAELERDGVSCDQVVILYANVPVRPRGLIDEAVRLLRRTGCDSVQSYCPVGKHHPWWTVRVDGAGTGSPGVVRPWEGDTLYHNVFRRQDLPPAFVPDGGVCAVMRRALFGEVSGVGPGPHAFLGRDRRAVVTEAGAVVDIDSKIDLLVADALLRERAWCEPAPGSARPNAGEHSPGPGSAGPCHVRADP